MTTELRKVKPLEMIQDLEEIYNNIYPFFIDCIKEYFDHPEEPWGNERDLLESKVKHMGANIEFLYPEKEGCIIEISKHNEIILKASLSLYSFHDNKELQLTERVLKVVETGLVDSEQWQINWASLEQIEKYAIEESSIEFPVELEEDELVEIIKKAGYNVQYVNQIDIYNFIINNASDIELHADDIDHIAGILMNQPIIILRGKNIEDIIRGELQNI